MSPKCPECKSQKIITDYETKEIICRDCGYVLPQLLLDSENPEKNSYDEKQWQKRTRVGAPTTHTVHDKGLSTTIDWKDRDSYGRPLNPKQRSQMYRLRKWQRRCRVANATERNLAIALSNVKKGLEHLTGIPPTVYEEVCRVYTKAVERKIVRGRSIDGVAAGSAYLVLRQYDIPRTIGDVAKAFNVERKEIGRVFRYLFKEFDLSIEPPRHSNYISKICNEIKADGRIEGYANNIIQGAKKSRKLSGRGPSGISAAAVYIASILTGERKTQYDIAKASQVTEVTIRNRYKDLLEKLWFETSH